MTTLATLRGIAKSYGSGEARTQVLGPLDMELRTGELTLVMGPSGSGKTTLLMILGLLLSPTSGTLSIAGQVADGVGEQQRALLRRRHIAFIFQHFNLLEALTARENIMAALNLDGIRGRRARERANELLALLDLEAKVNSLPRELSGGQKQRVGIARALAMPGPLVLADEPTAALDSSTGASVMQTLARLAETEDRAVIAVTHDSRWSSLAHRMIRLQDGVMVDQEVPHEALTL